MAWNKRRTRRASTSGAVVVSFVHRRRAADVASRRVGADGQGMRPIPRAAEFQFLVGLEIGQVCLDPWGTQLRFEGGGQLSVYGPFEHIDATGVSHLHQAGPEQDRGPVYLRDLIQQTITGLEATEAELTLTFGNGARLRISSELGDFETAVIQAPDARLPPLVF